jgi:xanthine dehydrogenase accessory factor
MNDNLFIAETIVRQLEDGKPVVLITNVEIHGSTPRHAGAKMVVGENGKPYGTIGGSIFEAKSIERAKYVVKTGRPEFLGFEFNETTPDGMVCGGKALVLLDYIDNDVKNVKLFQKWIESARAGKSFYYLVQVGGTDTLRVNGRALLFREGTIAGDLELPVPQIDTVKSEVRHISGISVIPLDNVRVVADPVNKLETLYLFGAGHVSVPTAHIASMVGFRIVVIDDRGEFANAERFPDAEDIRVADYYQVFDSLEIGSDSYVAIMTRGHMFDEIVLEQALKTRASYIGMISSRKKLESIALRLRTKGVDPQELKRIHSPIGIDIRSETPEEIAVSIVAELIQVRSGLES